MIATWATSQNQGKNKDNGFKSLIQLNKDDPYWHLVFTHTIGYMVGYLNAIQPRHIYFSSYTKIWPSWECNPFLMSKNLENCSIPNTPRSIRKITYPHKCFSHTGFYVLSSGGQVWKMAPNPLLSQGS